MASPKENSGLLILLAAAILYYFYWQSKPKGSGLQNGCGCASTSQAPVNNTVPTNPAQGTSTSGQHLKSGYRNGGKADLAGTAAPGSNASTPGSGANWQGLTTTPVSALAPAPTPSAPSTPIGTSVWQGNARPIFVPASGVSA